MRLFPPYMIKLLKLVGETNCKARIRPKADTVGTTALELVREMWASLLNEAPSMTSDKLASEIARIERIQSHFESQMSLKPPQGTLHAPTFDPRQSRSCATRVGDCFESSRGRCGR